jgi:hypothetical protein
MKKGVIVQVVKDDLAYIEEEISKRRFVFEFSMIKGYRGESAQELGLREGSQVLFRATDGIIAEVELIGKESKWLLLIGLIPIVCLITIIWVTIKYFPWHR